MTINPYIPPTDFNKIVVQDIYHSLQEISFYIVDPKYVAESVICGTNTVAIWRNFKPKTNEKEDYSKYPSSGSIIAGMLEDDA